MSTLCTVCRAVIGGIDTLLTPADRKTEDKIEKVMQTYCDTAKNQDKKMVRVATQNPQSSY